ncbi:MAG: site-specific integrase [Rhodanobacteraceae bacterium]|nr:MAG: site-specific integrase [Rhodanobacteraceae bacterium]
MATIVRTLSGTWKAVIRKTGWPTASKTFRIKRDAEDWSRRTEDDMVRGAYVRNAAAERMTVATALERYLREVTPTKKPSTQQSERRRAVWLAAELGRYSLTALTPEVIAGYRDRRLAGDVGADGKQHPRSNNTVRLELALLGHLFTVALKEWGLGLTYNPVLSIRRPAPGAGRDRRLSPDEERRLLGAVDAYSNPMLGWIVRLALETGMRASEIRALTRKQVDLTRRVVRLHDTKNASPRTVPLTRRAVEVLRAALDNPVRPIGSDLVFFGEPGHDGKRRSYEFNPAWLEIKHSCGLADLHFHDLRHEAVSRLVEAGLSDQEVAAISGHKSMQMLKRYTHLRAEDLVGRLDAIAQAR